MKILTPLVLLGLLAPALALASQEGKEPPKKQDPKGQEPEKKRGNAVTRFFEGEVERLTTETEGSWMLFDYSDPREILAAEDASGFATFHDGFLTMILAIDTVESRLFLAGEMTLLQTGSYRYRFDESGNLQLANVISFTNQTEDGEVDHEPAGSVYEYFARLDEDVLELRNSDGVALSFRKMTAGDFPESAKRKLESRRSGNENWEVEDDEKR
jgi:hypothetical protein